MRRNPKTAALAAATILALIIPATASANQTVQLTPLNCSVTAYTPSYGGYGYLEYTGGVSCGGSQAGYSKNLAVGLWDLVTGGWQPVRGSGWFGWTSSNPDRGATGWDCVPGRWYATQAEGWVQGGGYSVSSSAYTFTSGYQCR